MNIGRTLLLASLLAPGAAFATGPDHLSYDNLDVFVTSGEVDDDLDFTGFSVEGSWGFHQNFALFTRLGTSEIDLPSSFPADIESTEISVGINPHIALGENLDLVFPVGLEYADVDAGIVSDDDVGYSIGVGVRALLSPSWELAGGVQHMEIFDGDQQTINGSVRWHINDLFSLALGASAGDDVTAFSLGGRFSF